MFPRAAGVLLHPTSLPGPGPSGDFGRSAYAFVDWLHAAGCRLWQVLPMVPPAGSGSPYLSASALCGSPWLIDLEGLASEGLLDRADCVPPPHDANRADGSATCVWKGPLLARAADRLLASPHHPMFDDLQRALVHATWAVDAGLFAVLKRRSGDACWWTWPRELRDRDPAAVAHSRQTLHAEVAREVAIQVFFSHQWARLRAYAAERGVRVIGDVPIYVDVDSVDVWCAPHLFQLDDQRRPTAVAGVPPDYFSATGQLWGNPLYDWNAMQRDGFRWWTLRLKRALAHADLVRLDHFRGFSAYWSVPAGSADARGGQWQPGPGAALFAALRRSFGALPLIAEDLGDIDAAVVALREGQGLPGMKVLQFAFGGARDHPFLPHHHGRDFAVYTGTHDNDTARGWWLATPAAHDHLRKYLGVPGTDVAWDLIRAALASCAHTAIVPAQDVLDLGSEARLNVPGVTAGNWSWRLRDGQLTEQHAARFRSLAEVYGRV
ncbi:MAG: 4-alpha-glucanotransferase [Myxococcales bacterium]|nr:4-alpha-glucanotransferase [Myxococcales bacterium]